MPSLSLTPKDVLRIAGSIAPVRRGFGPLPGLFCNDSGTVNVDLAEWQRGGAAVKEPFATRRAQAVRDVFIVQRLLPAHVQLTPGTAPPHGTSPTGRARSFRLV
jgi:hypothetical protein